MVIKINDASIAVQIKYSSRKTMSMRFVSKDTLEVRCPYGIRDNIILNFISKNESWIREQTNKYSNYAHVRSYEDGEIFYFQGQAYTLKITEIYGTNEARGNSILLDRLDNIIKAECKNKENIKDILSAWYKYQASLYIKERVNYYENILGVKSKGIYVKNQKTLWGSCSSKRNLNFNVKLIMMPENILDYVIVHEICHLIYFNHSKEFWKKVESIIPDYKERKKFLKFNGKNYYL